MLTNALPASSPSASRDAHGNDGPSASRGANGEAPRRGAARYAVSLLDLNAVWQAPAGAALVESAIEGREQKDAVLVKVVGDEALVLSGLSVRVARLATALAGMALPGAAGRMVRVYAEGPEGWRRVPAPPPPRRRRPRRRGSRQGPRVARRGAIRGAFAPVAMAATGAAGGALPRRGGEGGDALGGANVADGDTATPGIPVSSCGNETCVPGPQSRACAREIREGGGPPGPGAEGACPHPEDARGSDPYAAGRVQCLACGSSWEARA